MQEELETLLDDSGHLRTLAFLYASRGMSSKALSIWRILARNYSSGLWKDPVFKNGPDDTRANIICGKETAATEASKILEESSDPELVIQHLGWVCTTWFLLRLLCVISQFPDFGKRLSSFTEKSTHQELVGFLRLQMSTRPMRFRF